MTIRNEINIETRSEYELSSSEPVHVDIKREPNDPRGTRTIMTTRGSKPPRHIWRPHDVRELTFRGIVTRDLEVKNLASLQLITCL